MIMVTVWPLVAEQPNDLVYLDVSLYELVEPLLSEQPNDVGDLYLDVSL